MSVRCHRSIHVKVIYTVGYVILPGIEKSFCGTWTSYELRRLLRKKIIIIIKSRSKSECFRTYTEFKRKNDICCFLKLTNDINITEAESNVNPSWLLICYVTYLCNVFSWHFLAPFMRTIKTIWSFSQLSPYSRIYGVNRGSREDLAELKGGQGRCEGWNSPRAYPWARSNFWIRNLLQRNLPKQVTNSK